MRLFIEFFRLDFFTVTWWFEANRQKVKLVLSSIFYLGHCLNSISVRYCGRNNKSGREEIRVIYEQIRTVLAYFSKVLASYIKDLAKKQ